MTAGGRSVGRVILVTAIPMFLVSLNNLVVVNTLPVIARDLAAPPSTLQWVIHAYALAFAGLLLTGSALGDRFGRRRVFAGGIAIFALGSAGCALSDSIGSLIAARVVQGAGAAAVLPISLTLLAAGVPPRRRNVAIGLWSAVNGMGIALGPLVGGALAVAQGWPWVFWITAITGAVFVPVTLMAVEESTGNDGRLDLPGMALAAATVVSLVWGITRAGTEGWAAPPVLAVLGLALALGVAFVTWERRARHPLLPLRFYRIPAFVLCNVVSLAMFFGVFGAIYWLMQYLQGPLGYSALEAGVRTLPWTAMPMLVAVLAGLVTERVGAGRLIALGLLCEAATLAWSALLMAPAVPYSEMLPMLVLGGIGMGLVFAPLTAVVLASVGQGERGRASGANTTVREIGFALGVAVLTTVVTRAHPALSDPVVFVAAVRPAVWLGAVVLAASALAALFISRDAAGPSIAVSRPQAIEVSR
ncbi:MFS transporter [Microbispora bryophytorum]|uniref:MFS transporter n=1 Tax=Microbispora bryophytorum TaxID=1460882 RepID=UPI0033D2CDE7